MKLRPVAKRLTISDTGSTSSMGTDGWILLNSNRPRSVAIFSLWSLTSRANSWYASQLPDRVESWRAAMDFRVPLMKLIVTAPLVKATHLQLSLVGPERDIKCQAVPL